MRRVPGWPAAGRGVLGVGLMVVLAMHAAPRSEGAPGDLPERDMLELGRRLFAEPGASLGGRGACIDCHLPEHGFDDPRPRSVDDASLTARRSQPLHDLSEAQGLHWDGSIPSLEALIEQRVTGSVSQASSRPTSASSPRTRVPGGGWTRRPKAKRPTALDVHAIDELRAERFAEMHAALGTGVVPVVSPPEKATAGARLTAEGRYQDLFHLAGAHQEADVERLVVRSIAFYVRSLVTAETPLDRLVRGEGARFYDDVQRGYELFRGRAGCAECHLLRTDERGGRASLRDGQFHNTGVAWRSHVAGMEARRAEIARLEPLAKASPVAEARLQAARTRLSDEEKALRRAESQGDALVEVGRGNRDLKTPTLRDVGRRTRFMHDGSFGSLAEVVRWYAGGCGGDPRKDERLKPFTATEEDVADLVAFLEQLTGPVRAGLTRTPWRDRGLETRLTLVDAAGAPLAALPVRIEPAGDVAWEGAVQPAPLHLTTDAEGRVTFPVGDTTHVRVVAEGVGPAHGGDIVPDVCREATLRYAVRGRLRVEVVCEHGTRLPETLPLWRVAGQSGESKELQADPRRSGSATGVEAGTCVDGEPWMLKRVSVEARAPVGAPPGHGPELHVAYEAARPVAWKTGLVVAPGGREIRHVDVARPR